MPSPTRYKPAAEADERLLAALRADPDLEPERNALECVAAVNEALAEMEAGRTISFEEAVAHWQQQKATLAARTSVRVA